MGIKLCAADLPDPLDAEGDDCFNANWLLMADIRGIMKSAGIHDRRILGKLCMNDPLVMTPKQCGRIADRLQQWLDRDTRTAFHWDWAMLAAYNERQATKPRRKMKRAWVALTAIVVTVAVYAAFDLLRLWGPIGDPIVYWLERGDRREYESRLMVFDALPQRLSEYYVKSGTFPPDDSPWPDSAMNLYYYLVSRGGSVPADDWVRGSVLTPLRVRKDTSGDRGTFIDMFGNPIQYRDPRSAKGRPLPDIWSAGRDRRLNTVDDIATWKMSPAQRKAWLYRAGLAKDRRDRW